jgi:hypothetical protein
MSRSKNAGLVASQPIRPRTRPVWDPHCGRSVTGRALARSGWVGETMAQVGTTRIFTMQG